MIEPSLELHGEAYRRIENMLSVLLNTAGLSYCLLIDRKGFVLLHQQASDLPKSPDLDSLGSLVAGNAAATSELGRLLGGEFSEEIRQGALGTIYTIRVGKDALLAMIFGSAIALGKVKVHASRSCSMIEPILEELEKAPKPQLSENFSSDANSMLDELLGIE